MAVLVRAVEDRRSVAADLGRLRYFAGVSLVVAPKVTLEDVEVAVAAIAERGFVDI